jgi:hypothetical protein
VGRRKRSHSTPTNRKIKLTHLDCTHLEQSLTAAPTKKAGRPTQGARSKVVAQWSVQPTGLDRALNRQPLGIVATIVDMGIPGRDC